MYRFRIGVFRTWDQICRSHREMDRYSHQLAVGGLGTELDRTQRTLWRLESYGLRNWDGALNKESRMFPTRLAIKWARSEFSISIILGARQEIPIFYTFTQNVRAVYLNEIENSDKLEMMLHVHIYDILILRIFYTMHVRCDWQNNIANFFFLTLCVNGLETPNLISSRSKVSWVRIYWL